MSRLLRISFFICNKNLQLDFFKRIDKLQATVNKGLNKKSATDIYLLMLICINEILCISSLRKIITQISTAIYWYQSTSIWVLIEHIHLLGLPWWLSSKEYTWNAGDAGSVSGLRRSPGEGNVSPLQYSCLGNPMDRGACWATVFGVAKKSDAT